MDTYYTLLESVIKVKTMQQWAYTMGYINAEYAHNFITSKQYDTLFEILTLKKEMLV